MENFNYLNVARRGHEPFTRSSRCEETLINSHTDRTASLVAGSIQPSATPNRSADFQVCCFAGFQTCGSLEVARLTRRSCTTGRVKVLRSKQALLITLFSILAIVFLCSYSIQAAPISPRQQTLLDADWLFHLGEMPSDEVAAPAYDDTRWQHINIPNDYVLNGTYDRTNDEKHGYLPVEIGWYRKHFTIPAFDYGKILRLDFDGVFRDSEVWVNGQYLGRHPSGYTPFSYDISTIAMPGRENIVAVRGDPRQFEGHWYEGGGIYRHVRLTVIPPLHVAQYGTYVVSTVLNGDRGADEEASLSIQTTVQNDQRQTANCQILSEIWAPDGNLVASVRTRATVPANGQSQIEQKSTIEKPQLWSIESPNLYFLSTTVFPDTGPVDSTSTKFGIRTIRYDADKGFFLNGRHVEIQGTANHQDFAGVGIAVPDSLQAWRVEKLKAIGCNA